MSKKPKALSASEAIRELGKAAPEPMGVIRLKFCGPTDFFGRLIAQYGWGYHGYAHVAALLSSGDLLDAQWSPKGGAPSGVQVRPDGYEKWAYCDVVEFEVTASQADAWEKYLKSLIGTPYDREDIIDFGMGWKPAGRGLICSWLQAKGLAARGLICDLGPLFAQFSPDTLYAVCRSIGGRVVQ